LPGLTHWRAVLPGADHIIVLPDSHLKAQDTLADLLACCEQMYTLRAMGSEQHILLARAHPLSSAAHAMKK
jgi:hypothetical protein